MGEPLRFRLVSPAAPPAPEFYRMRSDVRRRLRRRSALRWLNGRVVPAIRWMDRWGVISLAVVSLVTTLVLVATALLEGPWLLLAFGGLLLGGVGLCVLWLSAGLERR